MNKKCPFCGGTVEKIEDNNDFEVCVVCEASFSIEQSESTKE